MISSNYLRIHLQVIVTGWIECGIVTLVQFS